MRNSYTACGGLDCIQESNRGDGDGIFGGEGEMTGSLEGSTTTKQRLRLFES